jgi:ATP-dependent DNA helicase DinG
MSAVAAPPARRPPRLLLPAAPALALGRRRAALVTPDGEVESLGLDEAAARVRAEGAVVCHARSVARRLGIEGFRAWDLLELWAFARPASFCVPSAKGLADALGLIPPEGLESEAATLFEAARALLGVLARGPGEDERTDPVAVAWAMGRGGEDGGGWPWTPAVLAALGRPEGPDRARDAFAVWTRLPEWSEHAPEPPPGHVPVAPEEARRRLADLVAAHVPGKRAEPRPQQADYAEAVSAAFRPREDAGAPNTVLAEAGTGVGKTLGYLAPATLWAEKNGGAVWVSTYTRNLQGQIDAELDRLFPDREEKERHVVVRKGRENYLCLLNLEEAARVAQANPQYAVAVGLMARWAGATRDGDMQGGDFPGWLPGVVGRGRTASLADRRGECVYAACQHYHRCFIERSVRKARRARIVVANHALVMVQAALGGGDDGAGGAGQDGPSPTRFVFDEGHHLFDAADNAFSAHLTGGEAAELRRWILGAEGRTSRARGLKRRVEDLIGDDAAAAEMLDAVLQAARALPGEGWQQRIASEDPLLGPHGPAEAFLALCRRQVMARAEGLDSPYSLETDLRPPSEELLAAGAGLDAALDRLLKPLEGLAARLGARLDDEAAELDADARRRIDAARRSLERRGRHMLAGWRAMLRSLATDTPAAYVDWLSIDRQDGREVDVGLHRHWIDPTIPFAETVGAQAHGLVVTSATLADGSGDPRADWEAADARTGAVHLPAPPLRVSVPSPFDYPSRTRVYVVGDVRKDDLGQVAAAYRELFLAAGGGALGLFTAVSRLRGVHERIAAPLEDAGLPLLAQHLDGLDVQTLVDVFRADEHACLLGTDAVRDGVDVPGRSLRLIVFDRVPWPRPDILHRARRAAFGGKRHDDMMTRLRLRQAFGRLVRRADDHGAFVLLDPMMPSRLAGAFPDGVELRRCGLAEAVAGVRAFLAQPPH